MIDRKKLIIKILLWMWQLPQNLLGVFLTYDREFDIHRAILGEDLHVYYTNSVKTSLSLGNFTILNYFKFCGHHSAETKLIRMKKYKILSLILGWLYLPLIGIFLIKENL